MLTYHDMRNKLQTILHVVILNPLKKFASACSHAARYLFSKWKSLLSTTVQVPAIHLHLVGKDHVFKGYFFFQNCVSLLL